MQPHRLAVVSNRLPAIVKQGENGPTIQSGSGGLVTALDPVLRDRGGAWIGWLGIPAAEPETEALFEDLLARRAARSGYALKPVSLLPEEIDKYYYGFAKALLHDSTAARVGALFQLLVQGTTAQDFGLPSSAIRLRM